MADVTVKRVEDFEAIFGGGFRRVRAGLGVSSFGLAVMDLPPRLRRLPRPRPGPRPPGGGLHAAQRPGADPRRRGWRGGVRARARDLDPGRGRGAAQDHHRRRARAGAGDRRLTRAAPTSRPSSPMRAARCRRWTSSSTTDRRPRRGSAEQVGSARRAAGSRPRPGRPRPPEVPAAPDDATAGRPESLSRARSAAAASWSAIAIAVAASTCPWASVRPRQSSTAINSGAADRDLGSGRAATGARSCRRRAPRGGRRVAASRSRPDPPRRGVGVGGQQGDALVAGDVRGCRSRRSRRPSPTLVSTIRAAVGRRGRRAAIRRGPARPGAGRGRSARRAAERSLAGLDARQLAHAPLGLRDDLLRRSRSDRRRPGSAPEAPAARGDQLAEPVAGGHLGQRLERDGSRPARSSGPGPSGRPAAPARLRSTVRGPARRRAALARAREVVGRIEVERQRRERLRGGRVAGRAGPGRGGARSCPGRTPARSRRPGASSSPLVPVPWRSGMTATRPGDMPLERRVELGRIEQRAVAGQQGGARGAERERADDPQGRGLGVAAVVGVAQHLERGGRALRWRSAIRSARPSPVTTITRSISSAASSRGEHVGEHRLDQLRALRAVERARAAAASRRRSASPG